MKPGYKTTEFWIGLVLPQLLAMATLFGVVTPEQTAVIQDGVEVVQTAGTTMWGAFISVGSALGYGVARGLAKMKV